MRIDPNVNVIGQTSYLEFPHLLAGKGMWEKYVVKKESSPLFGIPWDPPRFVVHFNPMSMITFRKGFDQPDLLS